MVLKVQYVSDLHLEFRTNNSKFLQVTGDILVIAGDACELGNEADFATFCEFLSYYSRHYTKIIHVPGNHEYWSGENKWTMQHIDRKMLQLSKSIFNYIPLRNGSYSFSHGGVKYKIIGATLWSTANSDMLHMLDDMNDFNKIYVNVKKETVQLKKAHMLALHRSAVNFIRNELRKVTDERVILVTHHSPIIYPDELRSKVGRFHPGYESDTLSKLDLSRVKLAIHGHIHASLTGYFGGVKVAINARGYPRQRTGFSANKFEKV